MKTTTITFGTSSHYFKTSVQVTLSPKDDFDKALKLARKQYLKALAQELRLSKKFDRMSLEEIEDYIKEQIND